MNNQWSLGVLIGLPLVGLVLLICLIVFAAGLFASYSEDAWFLSGGSAVIALITLAIVGLSYYPYKAEYHQWRPTTGVVTDMNKRLVSDGDNGMSEKIVVVINGQEYGCNDTRCSLVEKGDTLTLKCKRSYEWSSVPGYDCHFVNRKAGNQT